MLGFVALLIIQQLTHSTPLGCITIEQSDLQYHVLLIYYSFQDRFINWSFHEKQIVLVPSRTSHILLSPHFLICTVTSVIMYSDTNQIYQDFNFFFSKILYLKADDQIYSYNFSPLVP